MSSITRFAVKDVTTGRFFAEAENVVYTTNLWEVAYFKNRPPICDGQEVVSVDITHVVTPYTITGELK
jgi:hypothetical protein